MADIFTFRPYPTTRPVSTSFSKIATLIVVILFLSYFLFQFISLLANNTPRLNTYK